MKQNKFFILAAALAFVACSSDDNYTAKEKAQQAPQEVSFGAYLSRATTRAGIVGENNLTSLQGAGAGFGVFAYYTNNEVYDQIFTPNFMYNQEVTWNSGDSKWKYTPLKYWPNEYTDAQSDENDKISFFAYAPYAKSTPTGKTDDATKGIAGFTRNTATGDPLVKYIVSGNIGDQVDLLWGVCGTDNSWTSKGTSTQGKAGLPWLNIQHPGAWTSTSFQNLAFNFRHALAGLQVKVLTSADVDTPTGSNTDNKTRVYIRSISFTGMTSKGSLNLNNTVANEALWLDFAGINYMESGQSITWYDGRKDGAEGTTIASNEKNNFLNPALIQSGKWASTDGVRGSNKYLFGKKASGETEITATAGSDYVYVIPTGENVTCTIEYDVLTSDDMLHSFLNDGETHGSVVKNIITKDIKVGTEDMKLENGKRYVINLSLGLKSVTFEASVSDWESGTTGSADLPANP